MTIKNSKSKLGLVLMIICSTLFSCSNSFSASSLSSTEDESFEKYNKETPVDFLFQSLDNGCCTAEASELNYPHLDFPYRFVNELRVPSFSPEHERVISIDLRYCYFENLEKVILPPSILGLTEESFSGLKKLTSINIPSSVKWIGSSAFEGDISLSGIELSKVKVIREKAFQDCQGLSSLDLGSSLLKIDSYAFSHCESIPSITFPLTLKEIGASAFQYNSSLKSLIIPGNVKSIGNYAFFRCESLSSLTIEDGVSSIGSNAFLETPLEKVFIPKSVTNLYMNAFDNPINHHVNVYCEAEEKPKGFMDGHYQKDKITYIFGTTREEFERLG